MLCALSQFLDRHAHVSDTPPTNALPETCSSNTAVPTRTSPGPDKPKNSYVINALGRGKESALSRIIGVFAKDGADSSPSSPDTNRLSRPKSKMIDLSNIKANMIKRSKSFPNPMSRSYRNRGCFGFGGGDADDEDSTSSESEPSCDLAKCDNHAGAAPEKLSPRIPSSRSSENVAGEGSGACGKIPPENLSSLTAEPHSHLPQQTSNSGNSKRHNRRHLPVPSGPYTVGCVDLMCDLADQGTFFRLYYPTNPTDIHRAYKQWPLWLPRKQYAHGYVYFLKKNRTIFGRLANWLGGDVYAPVLWQAPLVKGDEKFPVIIVSHGVGGNRTTLSSYSYELASKGFVVAALEHRDGSASMTLCLTEQEQTNVVESDDIIKEEDKQGHKRRHIRHKSLDQQQLRRQTAESFNSDFANGNNEEKTGVPNTTVSAEEVDVVFDIGGASDASSSTRTSSSSLVNTINNRSKDDDSISNNGGNCGGHGDSISNNGGNCGGHGDGVNVSSSRCMGYPSSTGLQREESQFEEIAESESEGSNSRLINTTASIESHNSGSANGQISQHNPRSSNPPLPTESETDHESVTMRSHSLKVDFNLPSDELKTQQSQEVRSPKPTRSSVGEGIGSGDWVRQRRERKRRSLRHNHSCTEEWRPFEHVEVWDDFNYRNSQMYQRAEEISDLLDELISMNEGTHINNAIGLPFTTNQFKNRLDFSRSAVIGHSFGGATTLATLLTDERFKVGLCLDAWMQPVDTRIYENTKQPALFLNMDNFQWERNVKRMIRFQKPGTDIDRPMMTMIGGCHQSMTDFQFLVPQMVGRLMDVCYTLSPTQCMSTVLAVTMAFLRKHLDMPAEPQDKDILLCNHPHLMTGTNVDLTVPDDGPTPPGYDTVSPDEDDYDYDVHSSTQSKTNVSQS